VVHYDDQPPLVVVNRVGLPWIALLTSLNSPHFHAFWDEGQRMVWDSNSSKVEEPNVHEREQTMGFHSNTVKMFYIFKWVSWQILGQVKNINCLTWLFNLVLAKQMHFAHCFLPTHFIHIVAKPTGTTMLVQKGWCCNNTSCTSLTYVGSRMPKKIYVCWEGGWWCGVLAKQCST
jgi:hypothetical protein